MVLVPVGVVRLLGSPARPGGLHLAAWIVLYPLLASLNQPNAGQHGRYAMFMIAPHLLVGLLALAAGQAGTRRTRWQWAWPTLRAAYVAVALALGVVLTGVWQQRSACHVDEINRIGDFSSSGAAAPPTLQMSHLIWPFT